MISFTLELIDALQWVIGEILLGDLFDSDELTELWGALCDSDAEGVWRVQENVAYQWEQSEIDDRRNDYDYDCCGYYSYRDD